MILAGYSQSHGNYWRFNRSQRSLTSKYLCWIVHFSQTSKALKMADDFPPTFKDLQRPCAPCTCTCKYSHRFNDLRKGRSKKESTEQHVTTFHFHSQRLPCVHCCQQAGVKGNKWVHELAGIATIICGLHLRRSEVLRSLRCYMWYKAKDVTPWFA